MRSNPLRALATSALPLVLILAMAGRATAQSAPAGTPPSFGKADVEFMQGMIGHHTQAIEMTDLAKTRTTWAPIQPLLQRISISQTGEIEMMQQWLKDRDQTLPDPHAHMGSMPGMTMPGDAPLMPGMLTPEQMAQLAAAKGHEFDRLFLTFMIQHHTGALSMVATLFSTPGGGQEMEAFRFANDVDGDQRAEITRMRKLLSVLPAPKKSKGP
jgi:uncharacterized protein (DUF305 family)